MEKIYEYQDRPMWIEAEVDLESCVVSITKRKQPLGRSRTFPITVSFMEMPIQAFVAIADKLQGIRKA